MERLEDVVLFVRTAALGSFSGAAREADLAPSRVSAAIQRLERELGMRLFARSTRSLRLTQEGAQYLPFAQSIVDTLREAREHLERQAGELTGTLQVAAPSDLGRNLLLTWLEEFRREHPALGVRLLLSDQVSDVFRDPVDVAIRYGQMEDASFIAMPLAPDNRRVLVASACYLSRHGRPQAIEELSRHHCLVYQLQGRPHDSWHFESDGRRHRVEVEGALLSDDADVVRRWAIAGQGIAYKSWIDVSDDVAAGRLEVVLPGYAGEPVPLHLVCPHRKQFTPVVQALHRLLKTKCAALPLPSGTLARSA
ncbi:LysR family transcriptional regulator [Billgrantia tianxiuensis]|uniref:LysR family transcriptional regulator n=1 Tax=Billgrantia tianxiuensis TaxID=2497861 RepID=A0A6I6SHC0_9GAMM|nr:MULTISPECIES: LysR family transcriptional regulator [Halomonas]MCE8033177.1 LysR family transcriptional regulator [Halomonas sp. MCCC 1A11057]QHC48932.1 LysR family transcriptional regulator [Halomonas tianxiuensis]